MAENSKPGRRSASMKKLYEHTQTIDRKAVPDITEEALWAGLMRFVMHPEQFNKQIRGSVVKAGAGDRPDCVYERVMDFGAHHVSDCVYLSREAKRLEFHVAGTKDYSDSLLCLQIAENEHGNLSVTFSYYASSEPKLPAHIRPLLHQAWEQKDKDILEHLLLEPVP